MTLLKFKFRCIQYMMKKNHLRILALLFLTSLIVLPNVQEKTKEPDTKSNIPPFQAGTEAQNCDKQISQTDPDDLSSLLTSNEQNENVDSCLFVGCNGFF